MLFLYVTSMNVLMPAYHNHIYPSAAVRMIIYWLLQTYQLVSIFSGPTLQLKYVAVSYFTSLYTLIELRTYGLSSWIVLYIFVKSSLYDHSQNNYVEAAESQLVWMEVTLFKAMNVFPFSHEWYYALSPLCGW
jgi:hypothetical protein